MLGCSRSRGSCWLLRHEMTRFSCTPSSVLVSRNSLTACRKLEASRVDHAVHSASCSACDALRVAPYELKSDGMRLRDDEQRMAVHVLLLAAAAAVAAAAGGFLALPSSLACSRRIFRSLLELRRSPIHCPNLCLSKAILTPSLSRFTASFTRSPSRRSSSRQSKHSSPSCTSAMALLISSTISFSTRQLLGSRCSSMSLSRSGLRHWAWLPLSTMACTRSSSSTTRRRMRWTSLRKNCLWRSNFLRTRSISRE
ncbi:hypothetical protein B0T26DRAFT_713442 [Lasiosphaeria miniovina]|uniref:Uncharacterized protein n=1 Tax=Lasiosphaeria miniovina TaxID=1954250 RepID=A0AA40E0T1_9PEZI|nr:uncharacterized protein B0T26DRAFT_713442 [Lasiosphaeria miniovina]KAK0718488.1 hypothetical protein B0T26DRAFT_713442 [Lasiosphaeria miniovina]